MLAQEAEGGLLAQFKAKLRTSRKSGARSGRSSTARIDQRSLEADDLDLADEAVNRLSNDEQHFDSFESYLRMCCAIKAAYAQDPGRGRKAFEGFAERWPYGNPPKDVGALWRSLSPPYSLGWEYIVTQVRTQDDKRQKLREGSFDSEEERRALEAWAKEDNGANRLKEGGEHFGLILVRRDFAPFMTDDDADGGAWMRSEIQAHCAKAAAAALRGDGAPLQHVLREWVSKGHVGAVEAFAWLGEELLRQAGEHGAAKAAQLIAEAVESVVALASVGELVEHPRAAAVLQQLDRIDPLKAQQLRQMLARHPSWNKGGLGLLKKVIARSGRKHRASSARSNDTEDRRPTVFYRPECMHDVADGIARHLAVPGPGPGAWAVHAYGGQVVRPVIAPPRTVRQMLALDGQRYPRMVVLRPLEQHSLRKLVMQRMNLRTWNSQANDYRSAKPPDDLLQMVLQTQDGFAPLTGLLEAPTIMPDGRVLQEPGYDRETGLLLVFEAGSFAKLPSNPTKEEARSAYKWLVGCLLDDFPFASRLDTVVAVALLITALVRRALDVAPGFLIRAALQSSGKTALVDLIFRVAFGRPAAAASLPKSEEEMAKRIVGFLREGQSGVLFDNADDGHRLDSSELAKLLTSEVYQGRLLGTNQEVQLPTTALLAFTGNALRLSRDLATRVIACTLAPMTERPEQRTYTRPDLAGWAANHRGEVVIRALTIVKAYLDWIAEQPDERIAARTRFSQWDSMVRQPLLWLFDGDNGHDLAHSFEDNLGRDVTADPHDEAAAALFETFGTTPFTAAAVWGKISSDQWEDPFSSTDQVSLAAALQTLATLGGNRSQLTAHRVGYLISGLVNRPVRGHMLRVLRQLPGDRTKEYGFVPLPSGTASSSHP
jgi:hypothetical protein